MLNILEEVKPEDRKYIVEKIELFRIDADYNFNCRGKIAPIDVADLVKSINNHGLEYPIVVHHYNEKEKEEKGKDFRLVSGFRRFISIKSLGWKEIPCIVKDWMPESKARIFNLEENLKRQDLNIVQEAKAIEKLKWAGYTMADVARELGFSQGWVQVRYNVLDFPEDIQAECAKGTLNQTQIKELYSLPLHEQYEAIRIIKDKKIRGEKNIKIKRPVSANSKRKRDSAEINKMLDHIYEHLGASLATRCLAWAVGNISSYEVFKEIRKLMNEEGKEYNIPSSEL